MVCKLHGTSEQNKATEQVKATEQIKTIEPIKKSDEMAHNLKNYFPRPDPRYNDEEDDSTEEDDSSEEVVDRSYFIKPK